jgi:8-oxo-dGTP diphosphatase
MTIENRTEKQKAVVIALIRNEEGKILLQKRVDLLNIGANGKWEFPGGAVEFGEDPKDALVRECQEEIGCTIKIVRLLPYLHTGVWHKTNGEVVQVFVSCFEAKIANGVPKPSEQEVSEIQWYTPEEIRKLDSLPGTNEFVSLLH